MTKELTTDERIAKLEGQIKKLQTKQGELFEQLASAEFEQWQGRIDDLEVQMHLGAMEANEHFTALADQFRSKWAAARNQIEGTPATTTEVVATLRAGLESAYGEIRKAVLETKRQVAHS